MAARKKAAPKKAAAKKAAPKKASPKKPQYPQRSSNKLPEGYKALNAGFAPTWEPEEGDVLEGVVTAVREVEVKRGRKLIQTHAMEIETEDGDRQTLWESALLSELFSEAEVGSQVFVLYEGLGPAQPGQNPPKLYVSGIQTDAAPF